MLPGWSQFGTYTLPATTTDQVNLNYRIIVPYQAGMQADFADVRFTEEDGETLIAHHRFDYTSGISATFWIKVPATPAAGKTIYIYWNNPDAEDVSDPDNVYVFWDDFSGDLSKWNIQASNGTVLWVGR